MPEITFTPTEQEAVRAMMVQHFGTCSCARMGSMTMQCDGHRFLAETDGPSDLPRIARMLFVRRTVQKWQAVEWTGRCPECQREDVQFEEGAPMCSRCADMLPVPSFQAPALPW
jgi:hypothetical protein